MLRISKKVTIPDAEIELQAMRAQGPGGQHVNKTSSAIHLRFNIHDSSLPEAYKDRLLKLKDRRITQAGEVIIKAQRYRSQERNREDALARLQALIQKAVKPPKKRKPTRPTFSSKQRRLDAKKRRSQKKALRGRIDP